MRKWIVFGLAWCIGSAHAAASLTQANGRYTLALDYVEVMLGGSKAIYKANLHANTLTTFTLDAASVGTTSMNTSADPATTPRVTLSNGLYVLEIPSVSVNGQPYAASLGSGDLANFNVDFNTVKTLSASLPTGVAITNVNGQTVGTLAIASSTKLTLNWTPPAGASTYRIVARETGGVGTVSGTASAGASSVTLSGLKASTRYAINVTACLNAACSAQASAAAVFATTPDEYWQLQGASGNGYASVTKAVSNGSSLSWVMRWGSEAGAAYSGRYQYYYKGNSSFGVGIAMATTSGSGTDTATLTSFTADSSAGLRNPCADPRVTTGCPPSAAYFINAIQAVPLKTVGKVRVFFEANDATESGQPTRIYSLDSQDGLVGLDFNRGSATSCGGIGSTDYTSTGNCKPDLVIGVSNDTGTYRSPLSNARQFKIGWDWLADWRWDQAVGTFMIVTGADACGKTSNGLFHASWDGSKWTIATDSAGCAIPLVKAAHGPVLVPLGAARYKMYYEDETNGPESGKPLRLVYADASWSAAASTIDIGDWEATSMAREVHFLWPDGSLLDAQDEAGLGDHMVITPAGTLDQQFMFVNLGGFDNSKWKAASYGLGLAKLLNP